MISPSPIKTLSGPGWLFVVFLAVCVSAATEEILYAKFGGDVILKPKAGSVTGEIKSITWKVGGDLAVELESGQLEFFREYKGRSDLNNQTGELTIRNLNYEDSKVFNTEINGKTVDHNIQLQVLSPVPVPTIRLNCSRGENYCSLTCEGNTTRAEPVNYTWIAKTDGAPVFKGREYIVTEKDLSVKELICNMLNPVSESNSAPFVNPLTTPPSESGPKISTGVTVFVILIALVLLMGIFHRVKTGEWFYSKSSYPWEADFWRNTKGPRQQAVPQEANGATTTILKDNMQAETAFGNE